MPEVDENQTPSTVAAAFAGFRAKYAAREPREVAGQNPDQFKRMTEADGAQQVTFAPADGVVHSEIPRSEETCSQNRYLWVIGKDDVPFGLEACNFGAGLESKVIKHTNLTGGAQAHCGGELWFLNNDTILLNGRSGRYGPDSEEQLIEAAFAFKAIGYSVAATGYDEMGYSQKVVAGDPEWL